MYPIHLQIPSNKEANVVYLRHVLLPFNRIVLEPFLMHATVCVFYPDLPFVRSGVLGVRNTLSKS